MTADIDFLAFYQDLHLHAGCSLGELKRAYRRRVAELHPDRRPAGKSDALTAQRLQELNAAYGAAMAFQRRHGRLPGARPSPPSSAPATAPRSTWQLDEPPAGGPTTTRPYRILVTLVILAALAWSLWGTDDRDDDLDIMPGVAGFAAPDAANSGVFARLMRGDAEALIALGADASRVRDVEGEPTHGNRRRWDYGPSWFEFEDGKVSNWYSAPTRPLHVAAPRPPRSGVPSTPPR